MTPIRGAPRDDPDGRYTQALNTTRNCVERCIGTNQYINPCQLPYLYFLFCRCFEDAVPIHFKRKDAKVPAIQSGTNNKFSMCSTQYVHIGKC